MIVYLILYYHQSNFIALTLLLHSLTIIAFAYYLILFPIAL